MNLDRRLRQLEDRAADTLRDQRIDRVMRIIGCSREEAASAIDEAEEVFRDFGPGPLSRQDKVRVLTRYGLSEAEATESLAATERLIAQHEVRFLAGEDAVGGRR